MITYFVLNLIVYKISKKHPYTILFKATCPTFHNNEFDLKYTGTELDYTISLPDSYMNIILKEMQNIYGYGPFDNEKVKKCFESNKRFSVKM